VEFFVEFIENFQCNFVQIKGGRKSGKRFPEGETEESEVPVHGLGMAQAQSCIDQVVVDHFNHLLDIFY
jgi:hypothetical protein